MKESWIVEGGWVGQEKSPPSFDKEELQRYCDDINKELELRGSLSRAHVVPLPKERKTPRQFADSMEGPVILPQSAPEFGDTMGKGDSSQTSQGFTDQIGFDWSQDAGKSSGPAEDDYTDEEIDAAFDDSIVADGIDDTDPHKGD